MFDNPPYSDFQWDNIAAQFNEDGSRGKISGVFVLTDSKTVKFLEMYLMPDYALSGAVTVYGIEFTQRVFILGAVFESKLVNAQSIGFNVGRFTPKESFYMSERWFDPDFKLIQDGDYRPQGSAFAIDSSYL